MKLPQQLDFLKSNRFWVLVGGCIVVMAEGNFTYEAILKALGVFCAGFVTIRSVDRFSEKLFYPPK